MHQFADALPDCAPEITPEMAARAAEAAARYEAMEPPFRISMHPYPPTDFRFNDMLPTSFVQDGELKNPALDTVGMVEVELDISRLTRVGKLLWIAGSPRPPRSISSQQELYRQIVLTDRMDLHLVWGSGWIYVKPLPRFLIEHEFWWIFLCCCRRCPGYGTAAHKSKTCPKRKLRRVALGFVRTYMSLIVHEGDFYEAQAKGLVPCEIKWDDWHSFTTEILAATVDPAYRIDKRFMYGELRLSRLDMIYYVLWPLRFRGYARRLGHGYGSVKYYGFVLAAMLSLMVAYLLGAAQVGLATKMLGEDAGFQLFAVRLTQFAVYGLYGGLGLTALAMLCYLRA